MLRISSWISLRVLSLGMLKVLVWFGSLRCFLFFCFLWQIWGACPCACVVFWRRFKLLWSFELALAPAIQPLGF